MKKRNRRILSVCAAFTVLAAQSGALSVPATAASVISITPFSGSPINNGVFEGWGTSLCWWANRVGYSDSLAEQTAELFFGDTGLRMNIARFNIGGGDDPTHDHITRTDSNMPGYTVKHADGSVTYDWNADANQRNVVLHAQEACKDGLIVEMFSNSPPYYMTVSGCSTGNRNPGADNLRSDCYDAFASYMAEVCAHYENEYGVHVQSVTPMNEPYTNFWGAYSPKQEGCHFDIGNSQSTIYVKLAAELKKRGLNDIIISASDETSIDTQINAYNKLSAEAKAVVGRIDTHTYGGSKRGELCALAQSAGKNLWMSEVDGAGTAGTNAGLMGPALWLAERMITDVSGLRSSAWILWQAIDKHISANGYNGKKDSGMPDVSKGFWGLAVADHDKQSVILTKKYYAFGQFSRYMRPGCRMLSFAGKGLASYHPDDKQLVITMINTGAGNSDQEFDLSGFTELGRSVQVIRTSNSENWKELDPIPVSGSGFKATLPGNSVMTFIIDDVKVGTLPENEIPLNASMVTGSAAWNNSSNDASKVVDGNLSSFFDGVGDGYVQIDLGKEYKLDAVAFAPRSGFEYRCGDAVISASADGQTWETLYTVPGKPGGGLNYVLSLPSDKPVRYVKYAVPSGAPQNSYTPDRVACCNIAELKLYGEAYTAEKLTGAVDLNGKVEPADAVLLRDFLLTKAALTEEQGAQADLDGNGKLNAADLTLLKAKLLK